MPLPAAPPAGLLSCYAATNEMEDKAEVWAHLMFDGAGLAALAASEPILARKLELFRRRAATFLPGLDAAFFASRGIALAQAGP